MGYGADIYYRLSKKGRIGLNANFSDDTRITNVLLKYAVPVELGAIVTILPNAGLGVVKNGKYGTHPEFGVGLGLTLEINLGSTMILGAGAKHNINIDDDKKNNQYYFGSIGARF